jgi:ribosomal-protein-alanine N-acetyltransferase
MPPLRKATPDDSALLAQLHGTHFPRAWAEDEFLSFFERDGIVAYIAHTDQPIGFIFCWAVAGECELLALAVHNAHRGQGIAKQLCTHAFADAKALRAQQVHLEVAASNTPAQKLYASLGFEIMHRRKGYYAYPDGTHEDALTMRLEL